MILNIQAKFVCDTCGDRFSVSIDPADSVPANWSMFEKAEDAIRGGRGYKDAGGEFPTRTGSVFGELHLCHDCTKIAEQQEPTDAE